MEGFDRIQLRRETRIDNGYKDVIRFDGGGVGVEGNLMGDEFSIVRNNSAIAHINARRHSTGPHMASKSWTMLRLPSHSA